MTAPQLARSPALVKSDPSASSAPADSTAESTAIATGGTLHDRAIGSLLQESKSWDDSQVDEVLAHQRHQGMRFGEAAVALGLATHDDVLWALARQFRYPYAPVAPTPYPELVVANSPFGEQAEAFRELRSQLLLGAMAPEGPRRALAVVSPDVGDGKTFIAANLAVAFSQLGVHTLLIDVDMRTPRQHEVFGIGPSGGLSNILSGRSEANVIRPVPDLPSLFVLPVGNVPPNPLELVQCPAFGLLMEGLLLKFDHVVVDTPAGVHGADAPRRRLEMRRRARGRPGRNEPAAIDAEADRFAGRHARGIRWRRHQRSLTAGAAGSTRKSRQAAATRSAKAVRNTAGANRSAWRRQAAAE